MIELTEKQWQELASDAVVVDPKTQEEYIFVRRGVYDRLRAIVEDDTVYATAEMVDRIMAEDDVNDPTLESYQSITRKSRTMTDEGMWSSSNSPTSVAAGARTARLSSCNATGSTTNSKAPSSS